MDSAVVAQVLVVPPSVAAGGVHDKGPDSQGNLDIVVRGRLPAGADDGVVHYLAASPPDYRSSFAGSALPFADARQAFDRTPNRGVLNLGADRTFEVRLLYPNAYYAGLGSVYVPP
jgi:hypothetical protein